MNNFIATGFIFLGWKTPRVVEVLVWGWKRMTIFIYFNLSKLSQNVTPKRLTTTNCVQCQNRNSINGIGWYGINWERWLNMLYIEREIEWAIKLIRGRLGRNSHSLMYLCVRYAQCQNNKVIIFTHLIPIGS